MASLPTSLEELRQALERGERCFLGLVLDDIDGIDLDLSGCDLSGSCFREARFGHAHLGGARIEACSFQQALLWGADLSDVRAARSRWHEADLSGSRLQGADFREAWLHRCCLRGVVAAGSSWQNARMVEADFRSGLDQLTDLGKADFRGADLSFALFQGAQLGGANLRDTCLYGANLAEAQLEGSLLSEQQLAELPLGSPKASSKTLPEPHSIQPPGACSGPTSRRHRFGQPDPSPVLTMASPYDLVVLGAGSGGLAAAKRAASYGAKVAIVEGDRVGGTCVIRGCVPKKLLVYGSGMGHSLKDAASYGWEVGPARCDASVLLANVAAEVDRLDQLHRELLDKAGVTLIRGWGRFRDAHTVEVTQEWTASGPGAPGDWAGPPSQQQLVGERVLIAVGGRPKRPALPGAELGWVSDDLFLQRQLPSKVVIVGAGFIACEFACILNGLGVAVTQLVRGDHLLRGFDREAAGAVQEAMQADGIEIRFAHSPAAISGEPGDLTVTTQGGEQLDCGAVILATGRRPFLAGLDLEAAGVAIEGHRIPVSPDQVTNVPHIYAVGDVTDRINLTPVAVDEGRAFADTVYGNKPRRVNHQLVASAVFSDPELASVGLSEEEAIERYGEEAIRIHRARFRPMAQALPKRGPRVLLKLVVQVESGKVLGCHMVGEHAAEIIQMAAIAIGMGATKADFDRTMALHPSVAEEFVTMPG